MAVEDPLTRIRQVLEERLGMEAASYLMDRPPGGWSNLVTTDALDLRLDLLRRELRGEMAGLRAEVRGELADVRLEMAGLRAEVRGELADVRLEMAGLRDEMHVGFASVRSVMSDHWVGLHDLLRRHTAQTTTVLVSGLAFFGVLFGILSRT